jgi:fumarate hydratase class II
MIEKSLSLVTALVPLIGYDKAAEIAKESAESNTTIRELCEARLQDLSITQQQLDDALDLNNSAPYPATDPLPVRPSCPSKLPDDQ